MTSANVSIAKVYELVEDTRKELIGEIRRVDTKIDSNFITRTEHEALLSRVKNLEKAVYGVAGFIVMSVIGALLTLVVSK